MKIKIAVPALLLSISFSLGWGAPQKNETKNGVRYIHNEKIGLWGGNPKVRLEFVRKFGGSDVVDEHMAFRDPSEVVVDSKRNLYILDRGNDRIQQFSPDGKFLRSIGRHGQGPGDFQFPCSFTISQDDRLCVLDFDNRRIQILNSQGKMEKAIKLKNPRIGDIRLLKSGEIVMGVDLIPWNELKNPQKKLPYLFSIIDREGKALRSFGEFIDYGDLNVNSQVHWLSVDVDNSDAIYASFRHQNRIEKYSPDGNLAWRADRILNYGTDVIDKGLIIRNARGGGIVAPSLNTVSTGIAVDGKGRIWVITLIRQLTRDETGSVVSTSGGGRKAKNPSKEAKDVFKFEIFDSEGILLGDIPIETPANSPRIFGDSLFFVDAYDAAVYEYKIIEN